MAEFLIYNKDHWSKSAKLTPEQVEKFKGCYENGDVVEVRPDGFWDKKGFNKESFRLVKKPGLSLEDARHYMDELTELGIRIARRKYQITNTVDTETKISEVETLSITTKTVSK